MHHFRSRFLRAVVLTCAMLATAAATRAASAPVTYSGRAPDAPWRKAAEARIRRLRRAPLRVRVVDGEGQPVAGAKVHVLQRRHAFGFGNILNPRTFVLGGEDGRTYRRLFAEHFNKTTFESGFRWHNWFLPARAGKLDEHTALLNRMIRFCEAHDVGIRGHYLAWAPVNLQRRKPTDYRKHPDRLWPQLQAHMDRMLAFTDGRLAEWDAINHIIGWNKTMASVTGSNAIYARIIRHARSRTGTPLWVNEGRILPGGERTDAYEQVIRYLVEHDAAPDGIGFMGHFQENTLRPIGELWDVYERFARFGLPLQLTEFDVNTADEQLQADYLRDVMTLTFSHPAFTGIVMWGFWEGRIWKPHTALWRKDWSIKPAGTAWKRLVFDTWWTDEERTTGPDGRCEVPAFLGTQAVTVTRDGRTAKAEVTVDKTGGRATVRF